MALTVREKTVVRNGIERLWSTKVAVTDQKVKAALRLMSRESQVGPVSESEAAKKKSATKKTD